MYSIQVLIYKVATKILPISMALFDYNSEIFTAMNLQVIEQRLESRMYRILDWGIMNTEYMLFNILFRTIKVKYFFQFDESSYSSQGQQFYKHWFRTNSRLQLDNNRMPLLSVSQFTTHIQNISCH